MYQEFLGQDTVIVDFLLVAAEVKIKTEMLKQLVVMVAVVLEALDRVQEVLIRLELQTQVEVQVADLLKKQVDQALY